MCLERKFFYGEVIFDVSKFFVGAGSGPIEFQQKLSDYQRSLPFLEEQSDVVGLQERRSGDRLLFAR